MVAYMTVIVLPGALHALYGQRGNAMQWEYKTLYFMPADLNSMFNLVLNSLGQDRWELVIMTKVSNTIRYVFIFKRLLLEPIG